MAEFKKFIRGFGYAGQGVFRTVVSERNMRFHLVLVIYMYSILGLTDWFVLSRTDWALIFLANAVVMSLELVNTAIEKTVDLVTSEKKPLAKLAKDAAAGAVLVGSVFAVCTGIAVLGQKEAFVSMFEFFTGNLILLAVFIVSLVPAVAFVLKGFSLFKKREKQI